MSHHREDAVYDSDDRRKPRSRRSRSRSRSPRSTRDRERHRRHDDDYYHDTLVVTGLPRTASERCIKETFSVYGDVKRITIITDEVTKKSIGVAWVKFWSSRDASRAYDACTDEDVPVLVDSQKISANWAKRDAHVSSSHRRSSTSVSQREIQQQIDWATANVQKAQPTQQNPDGFVLDPTGQYYFNAQLQVYYDPKSQLFYNCATKAYYRWDSEKNGYTLVENTAQAAATAQEEAPTAADSHPSSPAQVPDAAEPPPPTPARTPAAAATTAGAIKFSILGKKQSKDMDRWNKKKVEMIAELDSVPAPPIKHTSPFLQAPSEDPGRQGGIRPRLYVSYEKLACLLCQRKFKDEAHLSKHELGSDLHKQNLSLDEYQVLQRLQKSAKSLGIDLQPKTAVPLPARKKQPAAAPPVQIAKRPVPAPEPEPESSPFNSSHVGNRLLQSMGWKEGEGLGKHSTGITENVTAQVRTERAGLGCNPTPASFDIVAGDNPKMIAAKIARARYESASIAP